MKSNHWIRMIIGCGLPLLFIFLAPSFGLGDGSSLFIFIIFMFACHLLMPHGSHDHGGHNHSQDEQKEHEHGKETSITKPKDEHKGHHHH